MLNELIYLGNFIEVESSKTKVTVSNLLPRTDDPALNSEAEQVKVARDSFSGSIPPKFEHKLRRHKQSFGKITTTVALQMKICYDQSCNGIGVVI